MQNSINIQKTLGTQKQIRLFHIKLYNAIKFYDLDKLKLAVNTLLSLDRDYLNKPWLAADKYDFVCEHPPIFLAIMRNNSEAVRILMNTGIIEGNYQHNGISLIGSASFCGNEKIIKYLLAHNAAPNSYDSGRHVLMRLLCIISSYSLVYHGDWGTEEVKKALKEWYINNKKFDLEPSLLQCTWKGNLQAVEMLFNTKKGVGVFLPDDSGVSPVKFLENPVDPKYRKGIAANSCKAKITFISGNEDVLQFSMELLSRDHKEKLTVTVNYDLRELRALVLSHANKNKDNEPRALQMREIQELKEKIEDMHVDHKTKKDHKAHIKEINQNSSKKIFFETLSKEFNNLLTACKVLSTGLVERTKDTKMDKASSFINLLADHIPMGLGGPLKLLNVILGKINDSRQGKKHHKVGHLVGLEHAQLCERVALLITEHYQKELSELADEKQVMDLGKKALGMLFAYMAGEEIDKMIEESDSDLEDSLPGALANAVIWSKFFNDQVNAKLLIQPHRVFTISDKVVVPGLASPKTLGEARALKLQTKNGQAVTSPVSKPAAGAGPGLSSNGAAIIYTNGTGIKKKRKKEKQEKKCVVM